MSWLPTTPFIQIDCEDVLGKPDPEARAILAPMVTQVKNTRNKAGISTLTVTFVSGPTTINGKNLDAYQAGIAILDSKLAIGVRFGVRYGWAEDPNFWSPWYWGFLNKAPEVSLSADGVELTCELCGYADDMRTRQVNVNFGEELKRPPLSLPLDKQMIYHVVEWLAGKYGMTVKYVDVTGERKDTIPATDEWKSLRETSIRGLASIKNDYFTLYSILNDVHCSMYIIGKTVEVTSNAVIAKGPVRATFVMRGAFDPSTNTYPMESVAITNSVLFLPSGASGAVKIEAMVIGDRAGKLHRVVDIMEAKTATEIDPKTNKPIGKPEEIEGPPQVTASTGTKAPRKPAATDGAEGKTSGLTFPTALKDEIMVSRSYVGGEPELEAMCNMVSGFSNRITGEQKQFELTVDAFMIPWLCPRDVLWLTFHSEYMDGKYQIQQIEETVGRGEASATYSMMTDVVSQAAAAVAEDSAKQPNKQKPSSTLDMEVIEAVWSTS